MTRKLAGVIFALVLITLTITGCSNTGKFNTNLISNASFETIKNGLPENWTPDAYDNSPGLTVYSVTSEAAHSGSHSALVNSTSANDARFAQSIKVQPNSYYKISCFVKTENVTVNLVGANVSVDDVQNRSMAVQGTSGTWQELVLYGKTGPKQRSMTVFARLGYYGNEVSGKAYFDDYSVTRIQSAPIGVVNLYDTSSQSAITSERKSKNDVIVAIGAIFVLFAALMLSRRSVFGKRGLLSFMEKDMGTLVILLGLAFIARLVFAFLYYGNSTDMGCFLGWSGISFNTIWHLNPQGFYTAGFCDYPPGYMVFVGLFGGINQLVSNIFHLSGSTNINWMIIKLPAIIADMVTAIFVFKLAVKYVGNKRIGIALALLLALNPLTFTDSALWGQIDSILTLLVVASIYYCTQRKYIPGFAFIVLAALVKPQALMFGPIYVLFVIGELMEKDKLWYNLKRMLIGVAVSVVLFAAVVIPFTPKGQPLWIVKQYTSSFSTYEYASLSAFNLDAIIGRSFDKNSEATPESAKSLGTDFSKVQGSGQWKEADAIAVGHVTYNNLGGFLIIAVLIYVVFLFFRNRDRRLFALYAALFLAGVFVLGVKMHERYLFPVIPLLLLAYAMYQDKRLLRIFIGFSFTAFINIAVVQFVYWGTPDHFSAIRGDDIILRGLSILNIALFIYFAMVAWNISVKKRMIPLDESTNVESTNALQLLSLRRGPTLKQKFDKGDLIRILIVTVLYAAIAFTNLGNTKSAQTFWEPHSTSSQVIAEFDGTQAIGAASVYTGIGSGAFNIEFSPDGTNWFSGASVDTDSLAVFTWKEVSNLKSTSAKYVRITATRTGFRLIDIGFFQKTGGKLLPIKAGSIKEIGEENLANPGRLALDEQSLVPSQSTYMNSMYFDEIYHARTGYEFVHGEKVYEVTHPPLGKVFISWCIQAFGMTPFGWRFAGTMFGVAMLPLFYLFGKQLFKSKTAATLLMLVMALDGMHFVQTRIATIDSFGVFFVILMYYFMYKYYQMSFHRDKLWKTLIPLGLCGIAFGLGAASKWIGIYAGGGLAIIFFMSLYERYLEYRAARAALRNAPESTDALLVETVRTFPRKAWMTLAYCVLVFIIIPGIIYGISYYYFVQSPATGSVMDRILDNQKYMLTYHSGLVNDDHGFRSQWIEWPLQLRPMWYYMGTILDAKGATAAVSSISCFGNPLIMLGGLVCTILAAISITRLKDWMIRKKLTAEEMLEAYDTRKMLIFLFVGIGVAYLPWVLVARSTFMYHYFASVPFIMVFLVYVLKSKMNSTKGKRFVLAFLILSAVLFIVFYPAWSGMPVPNWYLKGLQWMPTWIFTNIN